MAARVLSLTCAGRLYIICPSDSTTTGSSKPSFPGVFRMLKTEEPFREESTLQSFMVEFRGSRGEGPLHVSGRPTPKTRGRPWRHEKDIWPERSTVQERPVTRCTEVWRRCRRARRRNHGTKGRWRGPYDFDDTEFSQTLGASLAGTCNISSCLASIRWFSSYEMVFFN